MGIDVNLYVKAVPTQEELDRAEAFIKPRTALGETWKENEDRILVPNDRGEVWFQTLSRYYGPGYERGSWALIYGEIRLMQAAFPGCPVFYGGDTTDEGEHCSEEFLNGIWDHFLGEHGDGYRERARAWNAAHGAR